MNAASLQKPAGPVPVAAAPAGAPKGAARNGIMPVAGQGFVPAAGAVDGAPAAAGSAPAGAQQAAGAQGEPTAEQLLQVIIETLGKEYGEPIRGADGTIYMERRGGTRSGGTLALSYLVIGKLDPATGKFVPSKEVAQILQAKAKDSAGSNRVLVKIGDQMVWQTIAKDENGKVVVTDMAPASEQEIAAHQQEQAAAQAKHAAQSKLQERVDWQRKIGVVAQNVGLFGSAGQFVAGLSNGPNPYSGKPGAGWISGWILAQRLNGKSEGKLLPGWMQQGPFASALEWGIQAYGMLDTSNDIRVVRDFLKGAPPLPAVNPNAVQQLVAKGHHPAMAGALAQLGSEVRTGGIQLVAGSQNAALYNKQLGAVQLASKADLHTAFAATDPIQDAGLRLKGNVDNGITKGIGTLRGLVQPAMLGATALGLVSSVIHVRNLVDTKGKGALLDTQQGRGAVLGAATSAAFLGMYLLPMVLPGLGAAVPAIAAASSAVNIAQNVISGVQLVNSYGLFGGDGFLDNDAVRAGFLIPPLTPIGAFAFWMKSRKRKQDEQAAKVQAAQQVAAQKIAQQREMAKLQLQTSGQISGAVRGPDGLLVVSTGVPSDPAQMVATLGGAAPPAGSAAGSSAAPPGSGAAPAAAAGPASSGGDDASALQQQRQQMAMASRPM